MIVNRRCLIVASLIGWLFGNGAGCGESAPVRSTASPNETATAEGPIAEPPIADAPAPSTDSDGTIALLGGGHAFIVPIERMTDYVGTGGWEVSEAQVHAIEAQLEAAVLARATEPYQDRIRTSFGRYNRRYAGVVSEGRRMILVSGFCETFDGWEGPVGVDDGGDCFFDAWYDPATGRITRVGINGQG